MPESTISPSEIDAVCARVPENLERVRDRIAAAAERAGRSPEDVQLVAVTKTWPARVAQAAVDAGADLLGENRVQEAEEKAPEVTGSPRWHLVGHLQRNKAKLAVELFDTIQSVDSPRLARAVGKHAVNAGKEVPILLEVNTSGEASKFGVTAEALPALAETAAGVEGIRVTGLMTIAAHTDDVDRIRGCFAELRDLRERIADTCPEAMALSMGMTNDFETAIEEGATIVRVGTAIFGQRA